MIDGFQIYDTHTHIGTARHSGTRRTAEDLLRSMDEVGVDRSVVIPFPVVDDYRAQHDEIGGAVKQWPDRFTGTACIYPFVPEADYREEVRRCREEHGFRALKFQPQYQALNPVSERSDFLFEAALENDLTVIVHTGSGVPFSLPSLYIDPARRFPDLRIVLGHAGGPTYVLETIVAAETCPNIIIELSSLMPHHIEGILPRVPASRLMAGSDLPSSTRVEMTKIFDLPLSDDEKRQILWETPRRVFDGE